jgi:RHS repeat-associated protein
VSEDEGLLGVEGHDLGDLLLSYDAFGRRQVKTLGATVTSYLYDGANTVQELTGGTPSANLLTGLGVDELFQRAEGATTRIALADALGSTLALADTAGVVQTSYSYAPYGETTLTGAASNNPAKYTGREDDSDGLYFYRARYYHPVMSRFVSEDPIGFAGGDPNLYRYAASSPTNFSDPSGQCIPAAIFGAALDIGAFVLSGRKSEKTAGDWLLLGASIALDVACVGIIAKLAKAGAAAFNAAKTLRGAYTVYQSIDKATHAVQYVGITMNYARRAAEHFRNGLEIEPILGMTNISKLAARGVEQVLIEEHGLISQGGTLLNKINSIAKTNPIYGPATWIGRHLLQQAGL